MIQDRAIFTMANQ